jgi:hypothetical protein
MRYFTVGDPIAGGVSLGTLVFGLMYFPLRKAYSETFFNKKELPLFVKYEDAETYRNNIINSTEKNKPNSGAIFAIDIADDSSVNTSKYNGQKTIQNDPLNITLLAADKNPIGYYGIHEVKTTIWWGSPLISPAPYQDFYDRWYEGRTPRERTIKILEDYARSRRLGRLIRSQWRHRQMEPARNLIDVLKNNDLNAPLSNEKIIDIIDGTLDPFLTDFNHAGAFIDHVNFVILKLSYGKYNSLEEYRSFKKLQDQIQLQTDNESSLPDQTMSPNGRRVVAKWEDSDIKTIQTKAKEICVNQFEAQTLPRSQNKYLFPNAYDYLKHGKRADALDKTLAAIILELEVLKAVNADPVKKDQLQTRERAETLIASAKAAIGKLQSNRSFYNLRTPSPVLLGLFRGVSTMAFVIFMLPLIILSIASGGILFPVITGLVGALALAGIIVPLKVQGQRANLVEYPTRPAIDYINRVSVDLGQFGQTSQNGTSAPAPAPTCTQEEYHPSPIRVYGSSKFENGGSTAPRPDPETQRPVL